MTLEQLAKDSGLPMNLSKFAKDREYSEPFRIIRGNEPEVTQAIFNEGLCFNKGGRYFHLLGNCDKGKATSILRDLFSKKYDKIFTIGVGDSDNDLTMLKVVDAPFYVGKNTEKETVWKDILKLVETF
jgi:mannosyl-3-phosphoglycerate phosphatase